MGGQLIYPALSPPLDEVSSDSEFGDLEVEEIPVDLTFGFRSTIASFPRDIRKPCKIMRPQLRSLLYDNNPDAIRYGLEEDPDEQNFRWLHVPSNNACDPFLCA